MPWAILHGNHRESELTIALASISTSNLSSTRAQISTPVETGNISPKNFPCTFATSIMYSLSVTKIRVRTTSDMVPPACSIARWIFSRTYWVWAATSPSPKKFPCASTAVVPATSMNWPTLTAREYPAIGSQGAPEEILILSSIERNQSRTAYDTIYL